MAAVPPQSVCRKTKTPWRLLEATRGVHMYVIIWQFIVNKGLEREFESAYGPDGVWVRFFSGGEGYEGTGLFREAGGGRRFLTVDRWKSREHYERFCTEREEEYRNLDHRCEELTAQETRICACTVG